MSLNPNVQFLNLWFWSEKKFEFVFHEVKYLKHCVSKVSDQKLNPDMKVCHWLGVT